MDAHTKAPYEAAVGPDALSIWRYLLDFDFLLMLDWLTAWTAHLKPKTRVTKNSLQFDKNVWKIFFLIFSWQN